MSRYIPNTEEDSRQMLASLGLSDLGKLFADIPEELKLKRGLRLPKAMSEPELAAHMRRLAAKNTDTAGAISFLGAGAYDHFIPAIVGHLTSRSEFYTAYTPYQPEISQGMLQAIFEYQTMICQLTGMDVSNASMYDGATALAEASLMAVRSTGRNTVYVSEAVHPEYREVLKTYARFIGIKVKEIGLTGMTTDFEKLGGGVSKPEGSGNVNAEGGNIAKPTGCDKSEDCEKPAGDLLEDCAGIILQSPNFFGAIEDLKTAAELASRLGAISIACVDPISLALLKSPGECGIDIVAGDGQSLGNTLSFGGPYLGFMAVRKEHVRKMPGRIVGETTDHEGRRGFVLTLQAREQHIRREKAVSNICSNQALNALAAAVYMAAMGRQGLKETANLCLQKSHYAYEQLLKTGRFEKANDAPFFKEFTVKALKEPVESINQRLLKSGLIGGLDLGIHYKQMNNHWLLAVTEKRTKDEIDLLVKLAAEGGE